MPKKRAREREKQQQPKIQLALCIRQIYASCTTQSQWAHIAHHAHKQRYSKTSQPIIHARTLTLTHSRTHNFKLPSTKFHHFLSFIKSFSWKKIKSQKSKLTEYRSARGRWPKLYRIKKKESTRVHTNTHTSLVVFLNIFSLLFFSLCVIGFWLFFDMRVSFFPFSFLLYFYFCFVVPVLFWSFAHSFRFIGWPKERVALSFDDDDAKQQQQQQISRNQNDVNEERKKLL